MARKKLKKAISKFHFITKMVIVIFLAIGMVVGFEICSWVSLKDHFSLNGSAAFSLDVGTEGSTYLYTEEGIDAVCLGRDVSSKMRVETALERDVQGRYIIPTDKEGVYTITYTVDCFKFGEYAPNGAIKRVRVFTVTAAEEGENNG